MEEQDGWRKARAASRVARAREAWAARIAGVGWVAPPTLPFFFCFFSTILTVMFLPGFHLMSVPIAFCKHSSSSSGSIRYVFVRIASSK